MPFVQHLTRESVLLAKAEATYGTDATPAATDAILISKPTHSLRTDRMERDYIRSSMSPSGFAVGAKRIEVNFSTELKGAGVSGTPNTAGRIDPLMMCCGCDSAAVTGPPAYRKYSPTVNLEAAACKSATIYYYIDGIQYKLLGCRGNVSFSFDSEGYPVADFKISGLYGGIADVAVPSGITYENHTPPSCLNVALLLGAYTPVGVSKIGLDLGMSIAERKDMQNASGLTKIYIKDRQPKMTVEIDVDSLANFDPHTIHTGATKAALSFTIGSSAGNIVEVSAPAAQLEEPNMTDVDGRAVYQLSYLLTASSGDDEFMIKTK